MRYFILISTLLVIKASYSQNNIIFLGDPDSIEVIVYDHLTKEMTGLDEEEHIKELGRDRLSQKEMKMFIQAFKVWKNYDERTALLSHYNIEFILYKEHKEEYFQISSFTRTIYHFYGWNMKLDLSFTKKLSKKLESVVTKILKNHGFLGLIEEDLRFPDAHY